MADTFRALCAELAEKLDELNCNYNIPSQSALVERARAALAQSVPSASKTPHKARPDQWEVVEETEGGMLSSCILELRDRIAALEATQHAHADASRMSDAERKQFYAELAKPARIEVLEANQPHQQDKLDRLIALDRSDPAPAPTATCKPLRCPSAATIAECGGPCEQGFLHCDCGLLEKMNPGISPRLPAPAGGLVERVAWAVRGYDAPENAARAAILAVAEWHRAGLGRDRWSVVGGGGVMTELSPTAQAVFWEFNRAASGKPDDWHYLPAIAAAIRTAAEQAIPLPGHNPSTEWLAGFQAARRATHEQLQAIAAELEGHGPH